MRREVVESFTCTAAPGDGDDKGRQFKLLQPYTEPVEEGEGLEGEGPEVEEEEEEGEDGEEGEGIWSIVSELPLDMQAYRVIEGHGGEGITSSVSSSPLELRTSNSMP